MSRQDGGRRNPFRVAFRDLRLGEPWRYKAPFLMSVPYFLLFAGNAPVGKALSGALWALCTIVGVAGFAYLSNDVFDRHADSVAGRPNGTADMSTSGLTVAFAFFLAAGLAPWILYLPSDGISRSLLGAEFGLLLVYSAPPFRLKKRGGLGLVADALYAHVVPALLAAHSFHLLTDRSYEDFPAFLVTLGIWQFVLGVRNVLTHQLADEDRDREAGISTYVVQRGAALSMRVLKFVLVPLELASFAAFTVVAARTMPMFGAAWPVYGVLTALFITLHLQQRLRGSLLDRLDRFLNEYYLRWMPLVVLLGLCIRDPRMVGLLLLHLLVFRNGFSPLLDRAWEATTSSGAGTNRGIAAAE